MNTFDTVINLIKRIFEYSRIPLFELGGNQISILSILLAVFIFYSALNFSKVAERLAANFLEKFEVESGVTGAVQKIAKYVVIFIGTLMSLNTIGVRLSSLNALMVGVGFGLQNIAQNFISGLIILLERPIKVGDFVEVEGVRGKVVDIRARSTLIHTRDDVAIIVPNSQLISKQVINSSFSGRKVRYAIKIGVAYGSDTKKVRDILLDVVQNNERVMKTPAPRILFEGFGESSLDFTVRIWVNDQWEEEIILSSIRFGIDEAFRANEIIIPFPQRDLHIKESGVKLA